MKYQYYSMKKDDGLYRFIIRIDKLGYVECTHYMSGEWVREYEFDSISKLPHYFDKLDPLSNTASKIKFKYKLNQVVWGQIVFEEKYRATKLGKEIL